MSPLPQSASALHRLGRTLETLAAHEPLTAVGGLVAEVAPSHCRIAGLSQLVKLGECVELEDNGRRLLAEVVRIEASGVAVKPFESTVQAGLGQKAWRRGFVTIKPHVGWKGRTINALGAPIDGAGPLPQGPRTVSTEREPLT